MKISILTIHPEFFSAFLREGLIGKAIEKRALEIQIFNIRDFSDPPHFKVDDKPYGGGPGMILKCEPIARAIRKAKEGFESLSTRVVVLAAKGRSFDQKMAIEMSQKLEHLILICGRYEGIDERVREFYADDEVRIGDYVLMGGELGAAVIVEAVGRLVPGVVGNADSVVEESFSEGLQGEYEHYTRPREFEGHSVPEVLVGGDHSQIEKWRRAKSKK